jgi:hypothetical protein
MSIDTPWMICVAPKALRTSLISTPAIVPRSFCATRKRRRRSLFKEAAPVDAAHWLPRRLGMDGQRNEPRGAKRPRIRDQPFPPRPARGQGSPGELAASLIAGHHQWMLARDQARTPPACARPPKV